MTNVVLPDQIPECKQSSIVCLTHECNQPALEIAFLDKQPTCEKCDLKELITLPFPFRDGSNVKYDFVLIPSRGSFLSDFNNKIGLHIGITRETGQILEYDSQGLKCTGPHNERWACSQQLNFVKSLLGQDVEKEPHIQLAWKQSFETLLACKDSRFTDQGYDSTQNNCFDFVLQFVMTWLDFLNGRYQLDEEMREKIQEKTKFCQYFIVPETHKTAKYISLYRKLRNFGSVTLEQ